MKTHPLRFGFKCIYESQVGVRLTNNGTPGTTQFRNKVKHSPTVSPPSLPHVQSVEIPLRVQRAVVLDARTRSTTQGMASQAYRATNKNKGTTSQEIWG